MIVYHILAWAIPLELITIIEAVNWGKYAVMYVLRTSYICITLLIRFVFIPFWGFCVCVCVCGGGGVEAAGVHPQLLTFNREIC